jgi:DNA-binding HxlR family transcriptional regulator
MKRKNKDFNPNNCPVTHFMNKIGGKWKVLIVYGIEMGHNRLSMLQKVIPLISKQTLIDQLRELEEDKIIERNVFPEVPPRVEYKVSKYGKTMWPVIVNIQQWGLKDMRRMSRK